MTTKFKELITKDGAHFVATGTIIHDPGVHTYPNGDPGYPPYTEIEDMKIFYDGVDITKVIDVFDLHEVWEDIILENVEYQ
jgi:hypothetical protein